ncbi:MAG: protein kinase domain-containing protein [Acidobacteriota bacterium]
MRLVGGRYEVEGQIGEGAMGRVLRVRHLQLGKPFALKVIAPTFASDTLARERFFQEAKLASQISHPNIVSVVDFGEDTDVGAYMVMELLEGEPVLFADSSGPVPIKRAIDVLAQVADALEHIHHLGIIHGDVKLENLMLVPEPHGGFERARRHTVRLLDFGLAVRHGTRDHVVSGSPAYIAPERVEGGPATIATDVYALGVLGYLLFTRTLPFDGPLMQTLMSHLHDTPEPMSRRRGEPLDAPIENLVARAMHKDPKRRHPSAAAFRYELNTIMDALDMRRRARGSAVTRAANRREAMLASLFEHSQLPQALVTPDGLIAVANDAFAKLAGLPEIEGQPLAATPFAMSLPGLLDAVARARAASTAIELRVQQAGLELCVWVARTPLSGGEVHLIARARLGTDASRPPSKGTAS